MGQHDLSYRLFFSHRRMIQALLRRVIDKYWFERVDFDSGKVVDTTLISPQNENHESDLLWRFWRNDGGAPVFLYILMEPQSEPDPSFPDRFMGYLYAMYQRLAAKRPKALRKDELLTILPLVVYDIVELWDLVMAVGSLTDAPDPSEMAELFRIKKCRCWWEIHLDDQGLRQAIPLDEATSRRTFETWQARAVLPSLSEEEAFNPTLEEFGIVLGEKIDHWNRELREKGRREGRQQAVVQILIRQLRQKFGSLSPEVKARVRSTDADRLLEWSDRVLTAERLQDVFRD